MYSEPYRDVVHHTKCDYNNIIIYNILFIKKNLYNSIFCTLTLETCYYSYLLVHNFIHVISTGIKDLLCQELDIEFQKDCERSKRI